MAYPYDQQGGYGHPGQQPGMYAPAPPGMFGATVGAMTSPGLAHQQGAMGMGASNVGMMGAGMMGALPTTTLGALGIGSAIAGMGGMAAMQDPALVGQGVKGFAATRGMGAASRMGYAGMKAMDVMDPFSHVMRMGGAGAKGGYAAGQTALGIGGRGGFQAAMGSAWGSGGMAGARGAMGMGARFAGAGMMGGMGAVAGAAIPVGVGMAAFGAASYAGGQIRQGAQDAQRGQGLMNDLGPGVAPGQSMRGQGAETGRMMRTMASDMNTGMEDIGRVAKQLNSQKVFQTTKSAKEFREKFKKVMGAVKEIAKITQGTIDDAAKTFTDLKSQGFHTTADIKSQAISREARESVTGISAGVYSAVGGAGAQMGRQHGMRGRFGARMAERSVAGVAMGVRSGSMSEEEVNERGGVEAVGMRMAQQQMSFLGTSRGRAMTAFAMGKDGAPDPGRLQKMLSGNLSMEGLVTGAAGRGLGVLRQAGSRESKEQMAKYAGMGMVSMAAMQHKQLYGGQASRKGIIGMMGTMGVGREESELMLQQTMGMSRQVEREQSATEDLSERARYGEMRKAGSYKARASAFMERNGGAALRGAGASAYGKAAGAYSRGMESLVGGAEYTGGDLALAREHSAGGGSSILAGGSTSGSPLFGLKSSGARMSDQFGELGMSRGDALRKAGGDESGIVDMKGGKFGVRSEIESASAASQKGQKEGMTKEQTAGLRLSLNRGDYVKRMKAAAWGSKEGRNERMRGTNTGGEFGTFFAAGEGGLLEDGMDFTKYLNKSLDERLEIQGKVQGAVAENASDAGADSARVLSSVGKKKETGLLAARDLESGREEFSKVLGKYSVGKTDKKPGAGMGKTGWSRTGGDSAFGGALVSKLTTSGETRQALTDYMRALSSPSATDAEKMRLMDELKSKVGDEEWENIQALTQKAQDDPEAMAQLEEDWGKDGLMTNTMGEMASREHYAKSSGKLTSASKRLLETDMAEAPKMKAALEDLNVVGRKKLVGQDGANRRKEAFGTLLEGTLTSGGKLTDTERDQFSEFGGQAGRIAAGAQALQEGDAGKAGKSLGGENGLSPATLESLSKIDNKQEQAEAIVKALKDAGQMDMALGEGKDKKSVQGIQAEYIASNSEFVTAVHAFVSAIGPKVGMGTIQGHEAAILEKAEEIKAGKNSE